MLVSEMLSEIRDHGFDDLTDTRLLSFINDTYWDVCSREPWPFLEATASVTLNASGKVTSPTDIGKVLRIYNTTANMPPIRPVNMQTFSNAHGYELTLAGDPEVYYFIGNDIYVWPIPSSATLTIRYIRIPAALTTSPDSTPILPTQHHRVIVLGSLIKCYNMEDDPELAALFTNQFEQRITQMRNDLWVRQFDRPENILDIDGIDEVDILY